MGSRKVDLKGPVLPAEVTEALAVAIAPCLPDAERVKAMRERVLARIRRERQRFLTVRTSDGTWLPIAPGIAVKHLQDDGTMQSFLLRLDAGARLPAHDHPSCDEHCVVIEGTVRLGDVEVSRGDYHVAYAGSSHGEVASPSGAILYLRTASGTIPHP
jgi:quercetin dioxygenase-like cupin family protein